MKKIDPAIVAKMEQQEAETRRRYTERKAKENAHRRGIPVHTPDEIEDIRAQALADPAKFAQWPLGLRVPPHHAEWYTLSQMYKVDPRYRKLLILAPTGFGKTTVWNLAVPIFEIVTDRSLSIGMIGNSGYNERSKLMALTRHLEDNKPLIETYGWLEEDGVRRFKSKRDLKWTVDEIVVAGASEVALKKGRLLSDPTIAVFGWEGKMEGRHFDLAIMDDVVDYREAQSPMVRGQQLEWYNNVLSKRINPGGREVWIGTRAHTADLYQYLIDTKKYVVVFMQALRKDAQGVERSTWEDQWPTEDLLAEREIDPIAFMLKRMNVVVGTSMTEFDQQAIQECRDSGLGYYQNRQNLPEALAKRGLLIYLGVDLAVGFGGEAKYFVCFVVGVDQATGDRFVLDLVRGKFPVSVQRQHVRSLADRWVPIEIVVESNAQQRYFYEDSFEGYPVVPMETGRMKTDLLEGVPSLVALVNGKKLHIPWATAHAQAISAPFVKELEDYPRGATSDILMSWWFCERRLRVRLLSAAKTDPTRNFLRRWTPQIQRQPLIFGRRLWQP